jgi:nicotinate-nucleotide pyrophosphorylase (carboxylating)
MTVRRITFELVGDVGGRHRALVTAAEPGVVAGTVLLRPADAPDPAGEWRLLRRDGDRCDAGDHVVEVTGTGWEIAVAGDQLLGVLGVAGGLARRAIHLRDAAPPGLGIACGGWKKWPATMKPVLRAALDVAGISHRLVDGEFVYVDKNLVRLLGGVRAAVERARALGHGPVAVQVVSVDEANAAVAAGAGIVMVDTGDLDDLATVHEALQAQGTRGEVRLAFGGGVTEASLVEAQHAGADIVDIGRGVLDAPLWDLRMEVIE